MVGAVLYEKLKPSCPPPQERIEISPWLANCIPTFFQTQLQFKVRSPNLIRVESESVKDQVCILLLEDKSSAICPLLATLLCWWGSPGLALVRRWDTEDTLWETWLNTPEDTVVSSNSTSFLFLLSLPTFQLSEVNSLTPNPAFPSPLRSVSVAKVTVRPGDRNWLS